MSFTESNNFAVLTLGRKENTLRTGKKLPGPAVGNHCSKTFILHKFKLMVCFSIAFSVFIFLIFFLLLYNSFDASISSIIAFTFSLISQNLS